MKQVYVGHENNMGITLKETYAKSNNAINEITECLNKYIPWNKQEVYFLCIGTDRSTGDSFAPLVGAYLEKLGVKNVVGTIKNPAHATNLDERIKEISEGSFIVALDASLGKRENISKIKVIKGKCEPGKGVEKNLTKVGDLTITYIVNEHSENKDLNFTRLNNTRLSMIMEGSEMVSAAINKSYLTNKIVKGEKINYKYVINR